MALRWQHHPRTLGSLKARLCQRRRQTRATFRKIQEAMDRVSPHRVTKLGPLKALQARAREAMFRLAGGLRGHLLGRLLRATMLKIQELMVRPVTHRMVKGPLQELHHLLRTPKDKIQEPMASPTLQLTKDPPQAAARLLKETEAKVMARLPKMQRHKTTEAAYKTVARQPVRGLRRGVAHLPKTQAKVVTR